MGVGDEASDLSAQLGQKSPSRADTKEASPNTITPMYTQAPALEIDPQKQYQATLSTSKGDVVIELFSDKTPHTVNNFVFLAKRHFYDNTIFHRVIKGFMIQGGDPAGSGSGGPGYTFPDEPFDGNYTRGTVAMANAGPDTNGSQFFIMQDDMALPKNYVIFGKVTAGMEVVDQIANASVKAGASGEQSTPLDPVHIQSVQIEESPR
jgi:peptidylprolyl isomerase